MSAALDQMPLIPDGSRNKVGEPDYFSYGGMCDHEVGRFFCAFLCTFWVRLFIVRKNCTCYDTGFCFLSSLMYNNFLP